MNDVESGRLYISNKHKNKIDERAPIVSVHAHEKIAKMTIKHTLTHAHTKD